MKPATLIISTTLILLPAMTRGQDDDFSRYVEQQEAAFSQYVDKTTSDFHAYNDSINREFARYLAETWPDFPLTFSEPPIKEPVPPAVYTPEPDSLPQKEQPLPAIEPVPDPVPPIKPKPEPEPEFTPEPPAIETIEASFYGTPVQVKRGNYSLPRLTAVDEQSVAAYWTNLSQLPYHEIIANVNSMTRQLQLNDWGRYQAINTLFGTYFPGRSSSEQTVFAVFMLNQCGYRARIGRASGRLLPLIAFGCEVFNSMYFTFGDDRGTRYFVVNAEHMELKSVQSCRMEYAGATKVMDMAMPVAPRLAPSSAECTLSTAGGSRYRLQYDDGYNRLLATYPCVSMQIYAEAAPSQAFVQGLEMSLKAAIQNKPQREAVGVLLDMVQNGFRYKTDADQFGYERWFFPEETLASQYCDCEDRSFLFTRLVRSLLGMDVVLLYYPGKHVATAVHFDDPAVKGDYVTHGGKKYVVCDPTFIGAPVGMAMPDLGKLEIIPLNN